MQSPPANVVGSYFDDHSIGGDNHLGWSFGTSGAEPLAVSFASTLTNASASPFRVCGYPSGAGWMRAYQVTGAFCPGTPSGTGNGWFRYVTANHSDAAEFNRWHLMDLQRFALVPVPGSTGHTIAWDNDWGTCLNENDPNFLYCEQSLGAASLSTSIGPGTTKITQDAGLDAPGSLGAPDDTRIGIPSESRNLFPAGTYQLVAISNPYGAYAGSSNVACTTVTLSGYDGTSPTPAATAAGTPATCYVPATLQPALTGPGGRDPLASEAATTPACALVAATGHCWATVPTSGGNPPARTNVTAANVLDTTGAVVAVPQGGALTQAQGVVAPANTAPRTPASVGARSTTVRRLTAARSRIYARAAVRKVFGRRITRLKVACRVTSSSTSRCTVSFRKSGARYSGHVWLRYRTVSNRARWQYRVEVKKTKAGRTTTVRRSYRTGGSL